MKFWICRLGLLAVAVLLAAPASAALLFTNGPINGTLNAYSISAFLVSDSFTLSQTSTVTSVDFGAWVASGGTATSVDWSITSTLGSSGTFYGSAAGAALSGVFQNTNTSGLDVYQETFSVASLSLGPGTYWLNLTNTLVTNGSQAFWDKNNGSSSAWQSSVGTIPSESFNINGTTSDAGVPEPGTWALGGTGLLLLAGALRRKLKR
jgi:hypothetical protein